MHGKSEALFATQGGGTAKWDNSIKAWVFVTPPPFGEYQTGDRVPLEWGVEPLNNPARREVERTADSTAKIYDDAWGFQDL